MERISGHWLSAIALIWVVVGTSALVWVWLYNAKMFCEDEERKNYLKRTGKLHHDDVEFWENRYGRLPEDMK